MKVCNTCERELPDNAENFDLRLRKGGVWGTVAKCKRCCSNSRKQNRLAKKIKIHMASQGLVYTKGKWINNGDAA